MKITYFNEFDPQNDYAETTIILDGKEVELDLNCEEVIGSTDWIPEYEKYVVQLERIKKDILQYINNDFIEEGLTKEWITFHLEEIDEEYIDALLKNAKQFLNKEEQVLSLLRLRRIGLYPEYEGYAIWDFVLDDEVSDEILTLQTDTNGNILNIAWES
ncbi:DUF2004 domain-containing protein [uncultured Fusobacterium sp.]|uniref:DUF2004 domain-containing protein n=1 Tax=uncultured Fusobacterium sp. TaxID=159267 RepID=UPI0025D15787|nr:DUF2004 domain-containing protein [uncultured Fusobacterium sp.]